MDFLSDFIEETALRHQFGGLCVVCLPKGGAEFGQQPSLFGSHLVVQFGKPFGGVCGAGGEATLYWFLLIHYILAG